VPRSVPPTPPATHTLTRLNDYIIGDLTTTPPSGTNYQNEVKFPGNIANCTMCHVDETYRTDSGMLGTSFNAGASATDPTDDLKISPKASSCSSCHDNYQSHMVGFGGASFSFQQSLAMETPTAEHCQECHGASGGRDVKVWHNVK